MLVGDTPLTSSAGRGSFGTTDRDGNTHNTRGAKLINDGEWHHVAATFEVVRSNFVAKEEMLHRSILTARWAKSPDPTVLGVVIVNSLLAP